MMEKIRLGVAREGKVPPDFRVPLTPKQCKLVQLKFPHVEVIVQPSPIRTFTDQSYIDEGITVREDLSDCDIIIGVKEVKVEDLIPGKKYVFFSHTIKKQPYNRRLLQHILQQKIELIDYEVMKNKQGKRLIGFGRYAGIVGCYNGFRAFGLKHKLFDLKKANDCENRIELEKELQKVVLPSDTKIVLTGFGRVGYGAREILDIMPIMEVSPEEFVNEKYDEPIFTHLDVEDYFARKDGAAFEKKHFYENGGQYKSVFPKYAQTADMYVACHFWSNASPVILAADDLRAPGCKLKVVADISCDIGGPIASTIRSSSIAEPIFGYNPETEEEGDFMKPENIAVMAVDNLPCELPKDASEDFGNELIKHIFPALFSEDPDNIIGRATETTAEGELSEYFRYLSDYVNSVAEN